MLRAIPSLRHSQSAINHTYGGVLFYPVPVCRPAARGSILHEFGDREFFRVTLRGMPSTALRHVRSRALPYSLATFCGGAVFLR